MQRVQYFSLQNISAYVSNAVSDHPRHLQGAVVWSLHELITLPVVYLLNLSDQDGVLC